MARTIAPTGHQGIWLAGLAYLIASSPTFQALTGAGSAVAALVHVATVADDTEATGSARPRAIVDPSELGLSCVALQEFRPRFGCAVSFEIPPPAGIAAETTAEDRWWDEYTSFCNTVDAIMADMFGLQGTGAGYVSGLSHVKIDSVELIEGPVAVYEAREEGSAGESAQYFFAGVYRFSGVG